jgi:RNA polymerase sigma factor (sigma-70 family)
MIYSTSPVLRQLRRAALVQQGAGLSDGQLLRAFLNDHDECVFEALVRRHGPMVMGVCRRILRHTQDAEDAFQAAFLVLVRKAASLAGREIVGDWLHGTALRTALKARAKHARRREKERHMARSEAVAAESSPESHALLDQELQGLPEHYRVPIILCELEGRTHQETARQLGCPIGTLSGRLSRARSMLARRLTRRGLTLSAAGLAASLGRDATAAFVNQSLVGMTVKAATQVAAGQAAAGIVSSQVAALTEGVVRAMLLGKLKTVGVLLLVVTFLGVGVGAFRSTAAGDEKIKPPKEPPERTVSPRAKLPVPLPERQFRIEFKICEIKKGEIKVLGEPKVVTLEGHEAGIAMGGEHAVQLHRKVDFVTSGLTVHTKVSSDTIGTDIDMTVSRATATQVEGGVEVGSESVRLVREIKLNKPVTVDLKSKDKSEPIIRVLATVSEVRTEQSIQAAERDFKVAHFYRRNGRIDSALFVYELILRRYPDTLYAEQAKERIKELKKERSVSPPEKAEPDRIGEIRIINKTKLEDKQILDKLGFHLGEVFTLQRLLKSEWKFLESGLFLNPPRILISCEETDSSFKNIIVRIEE